MSRLGWRACRQQGVRSARLSTGDPLGSRHGCPSSDPSQEAEPSSGDPEAGGRALGAGGLSSRLRCDPRVTCAAVSPHSGQRRGLASAGFLAGVLPVCPHLRGTAPCERVHRWSLHPVLLGGHCTPSSWGVIAPHPRGGHCTPSSWGFAAPHPLGFTAHRLFLGVTTPRPCRGLPHPVLLGGHCTPSSWEVTTSYPRTAGKGWRRWSVAGPNSRLAGSSWTCGAAPRPRARDRHLIGKGSRQMWLSDGPPDKGWSWGPDCRSRLCEKGQVRVRPWTEDAHPEAEQPRSRGWGCRHEPRAPRAPRAGEAGRVLPPEPGGSPPGRES